MNQNRSSRAVTALALTTLASSHSGLLLDISVEVMLPVQFSCYLHNFSLYTLIHYKESSLYPQRYEKYFYVTNFSRNILLKFFHSVQTIFLQPFHLSTIYPIQETKP